jgi:16S rRNA (cytidine1402-2'-O)-methyltransferase
VHAGDTAGERGGSIDKTGAMMDGGRLFVVATPIGNLEDITARALRVLDEASLIAAEDTRHSRRLLDHYGIQTALTSYHDHNEAAKTQALLRHLEDGRDVALISDAGTPCVSDPGYRIVRAAHECGYAVIPVPGPSAPIAALAASGLPNDRVTFHGFFPRKQGAVEELAGLMATVGGTHVFFESPRRLGKTLEALRSRLGAPERCLEVRACLARELTKRFEEIAVDSLEGLIARFAQKPVKGECVLAVHVAAGNAQSQRFTPEELQARVEETMKSEGVSQRDAIRSVALRLDLPRKSVYAAAVRHQ